MKKVSCSFTFVILMNIVFSFTVFGESEYSFGKWKGVIYQNCELRGITSNEDFVASVENISLSIENEPNTVRLKGEINYNDKNLPLTTKGKVYIAPGGFYNGNQLLINLEDTDYLDILSFSLEHDAKEMFLLKPNKSFEHKTVVRMAILDKESNTILHVEDIIDDEEFYNVIKGVGIELTETSITPEIVALDRWYTPYHEDFKQQPVVVIEESSDIENSRLNIFSSTPSLPQLRYSVGDLNNDCEVNSTDITIMKRYVLRKIKVLPTPYDPIWVADLDGDDMINSTDLMILKRYLLKK